MSFFPIFAPDKNKKNTDMRNILATILAGILLLATAGCSKEKYDLLPGEVQLKSTVYDNDDRMSYDAQTVWHAVVIKAQHDFEFENFDYEKTEGIIRKTYDSPAEAEEAFVFCVEKCLNDVRDVLDDKGGRKYEKTLSEIIAAQPRATSEYVWCSATDEFTTLKFVVEPSLEPAQEPVLEE